MFGYPLAGSERVSKKSVVRNRGIVIVDFLQACHCLSELSHAGTLHCVCAGLRRHELQSRYQSDVRNQASFKRLRRRQRAQDPDHDTHTNAWSC